MRAPHCLRSVPVRSAVERGATASSKYSHNPQRSSQSSKGLRFYGDNRSHQSGKSVGTSQIKSGERESAGNHPPQYTPPPVSPETQYLLRALAQAETEQKALVAAAAILRTVEPKNEKDKYSVSTHMSLHNPRK